jgi:hypothetical protein
MNGTPCKCVWRCFHWFPLAICAAVLSTATLLGLFYPQWIREHGAPGDWIGPLEPEIRTNLVLRFATPIGTNENARIQDQVVVVACRALHHFRVMNYYLTTYFTDLLLGCFFGGLSAISLAIITRRGWDNSSGCLISFFLSTTICTTFFFAFPNVCQMDYTAKANKLLYLRYAGLLQEARTFAAIGSYPRADATTNTPSARDFIMHIDEELRKVGDVAVSFDPGRIPIYDLSTEKEKK